MSLASKGLYPSDHLVQAREGASNGCGAFPESITSTPFPFPYRTNFSSPDAVNFQDFPRYLSDIEGVFRVKSDGLLHQTTLEPSSRGVPFGQYPTTVLGDKTWVNYTVSTVARLPLGVEPSGFIAVYARLGNGFSFQSAGGYSLRLNATGVWSLVVKHGNATDSILSTGTVANLQAWYQLALTVQGESVVAQIGGKTLASIVNKEWPSGFAGLGSGYHDAAFATFEVLKVE